MKRKKIIAANWKMYKTPVQIAAFFQEFLPLVADTIATKSSSARRFRLHIAAVRLPAPTYSSARKTCTGKKKARLPAKFLRPC